MADTAARQPVQPGAMAPDFTLPAVDREGTVSLADYRGKSPVLVAIFRGLYCPFCRRAVAQMGVTREKLQAIGVATLGIVATNIDNARLYFKFRPARVPLAADPALTTHRLYGLPRPLVTPELLKGIESLSINPTGELPAPLPLAEAARALDQLHGFQPTKTDQEDSERQFPQLKGQFLIDKNGVVSWTNVECAREGLAGFGKFPTDDEILAAARAL
jgi:peroxiredoxin